MYTDIFTCNGKATLFQMFAPGGTPHSHNEGAFVSDEAGWPTWNGGGCKSYAGVFCCAADALVDLIGLSASSWGAFGSVQSGDGQNGNASFVYQALDGACSCNGTPDTINKRDGHGASLGIRRNIQPSNSSSILNQISKKHRRRDVIAKTEAERERGESTPALIRRVNHSPTWNKYAEAGVKFWNEFNRRLISLLFMERASYRLGSTRTPLGQGRMTSALKYMYGLSLRKTKTMRLQLVEGVFSWI